MAIKIWSHNPGSHTARELAKRMRIRVLAAPDQSRYIPRTGDIVINYGNSEWSDRITAHSMYTNNFTMLNHPVYVEEVSNKIRLLDLIDGYEDEEGLRGVTVPWTTRSQQAVQWCLEGHDVVIRHKIKGHSGDGIQIMLAQTYMIDRTMPEAPLYTKYIKKSAEHRIHMIRNHDNTCEFIWQQKKRSFDCSTPDWRIRNYENGFIYAIEDVQKPEGWRRIESVLSSTINLAFSATDILTPNSTNPRAVRVAGSMILEVNSAPGLQSDTLLDWYVDHLTKRIRDGR